MTKQRMAPVGGPDLDGKGVRPNPTFCRVSPLSLFTTFIYDCDGQLYRDLVRRCVLVSRVNPSKHDLQPPYTLTGRPVVIRPTTY